MSDRILPDAFINALWQLAGWLTESKVPHVTIGGIAVSLIAQPRATQDIDAVIWLQQDDWESFLAAADAHGFEPRISGALEFAKRSRVLLLRHRETGINVDISCGALPFEREMIDRAQTVSVQGHELTIATPEDLIITKVVAQRAKDIADIESILAVHPDVDLDRIRHWVAQFCGSFGNAGAITKTGVPARLYQGS